jgi:hypothetical protein
MKDTNIIVSETNRPYWKLILAALVFTIVIYLIFEDYKNFQTGEAYLIQFVEKKLFAIVMLSVSGVVLSIHKKVYIDLNQSRFKPTVEIGFLKFGRWKTIRNYEYVSVFFNALAGNKEPFIVNLWYDTNQYFELYSRDNFEDALTVAYDLSEVLNIDLLDATIRDDFKWIDKDALKAEH